MERKVTIVIVFLLLSFQQSGCILDMNVPHSHLHHCVHDQIQSQVNLINLDDDIQSSYKKFLKEEDSSNSNRQLSTPTHSFQNGFLVEIVQDVSLNNLSASSKAEVVSNMLPFASAYVSKLIKQTLTTRSYSLPQYKGQKCYKFTMPSIITDSTFQKDLVIIVGAEAQQGNTLAYAVTCVRSKGRPIVGEVMLNTNLDYSQNSVEKNLVTLIHEIMHIVGLSSSHLKYAVDSSLNTIPESKVTNQVTRRGKTVNQIISPKVVAYARDYFKCNTMTGVELEDQGGSGSAGSHWEERIVPEAMMQKTVHYGAGLTGFTLSLMEDYGWYKVEMQMAHNIQIGKAKGCDFIEQKCIKNENGQYVGVTTDFQCTPKQNQCTESGNAGGVCGGTSDIDISTLSNVDAFDYYGDKKARASQMDYCPHVTEYSNQMCTYLDPQYPPSSYYITEVGNTHKCVMNNVIKKGHIMDTLRASCMKVVECKKSIISGNEELTLEMGGVKVICKTEGQQVDFAATVKGIEYTGKITCPSITKYCQTYSATNYQQFLSYSKYPYEDKLTSSNTGGSTTGGTTTGGSTSGGTTTGGTTTGGSTSGGTTTGGTTNGTTTNGTTTNRTTSGTTSGTSNSSSSTQKKTNGCIVLANGTMNCSGIINQISICFIIVSAILSVLTF